jgi:hypothetical protein
LAESNVNNPVFKQKSYRDHFRVRIGGIKRCNPVLKGLIKSHILKTSSRFPLMPQNFEASG